VIKHQFGLMKMRFRGLAKNTARLITLFALCEYVDGATQATGNDIRIASLDCEMSRKAEARAGTEPRPAHIFASRSEFIQMTRHRHAFQVTCSDLP
jgi:hypothetical protein